MGFSEKGSAAQRALEQKFDASLRADSLRVWMQRLAGRPHHAGSPYGKENAEFMRAQFASWGFDAKIEEFHVLFPTPRTRVLEMLSPISFKADLVEPPVEGDGSSTQQGEHLPTYNCYSVDGDVTGELVYVNYGVPKDYEELEERGIDVKGKIVIARYGGSWRGIKPKVAAEHGALGCIIYSDPRDDGYAQGDVYPKGAYRNDDGVQRGSVADMPLYPGDPLTPGVGATKDARRLDVKEAETLTKIPVLPISYGDALPLLQALEGPVAPEGWRGALPITYHIGPGPATVRLALAFNWDIVPIYNVIAMMKGSEFPDEWIIRGNHHDAWVHGAADPISGMVATMEEARAIGLLRKSGFAPKRTLVYCAWDGEEQGLLGSTEWVEAHADDLRVKGAVYINSDSNGRGFLSAGGSHTLEKFVNEVARDVIDPQKGISVADRARALDLVYGSPDDKKDARDRADLRIYPLGSGSDYSPFLQHLGMASLNLGYGGESGGGSYHSVYDSYEHYARFGDPAFAYGVALAQTAGRTALRLANADVLPFEFGNSAETIEKFSAEVAKLADNMRDETETINRLLAEKKLEHVADPTETFVPPAPKDAVPFLNFAPLQNAVNALEKNAKEFTDAIQSARAQGNDAPVQTRKALNDVLMHAEQALTRAEGLPGRPWYIHQIYAPGMYTGYGVKTLPAVREAIEQRNWTEADEQIVVVAGVIEKFSGEVRRAIELLKTAAVAR